MSDRLDAKTNIRLRDTLESEHKNLKFLVKQLEEELCRFSHCEDDIDVCEVITRCNEIKLHTEILKNKMSWYVPDSFNPNGIVYPLDFDPGDDHDESDQDDEYDEYDPHREHPRESLREPVDRFRFE